MYQEPNDAGSSGDASAEPPVSASRSIFRTEAYQNYVVNKEKVVLPRLVSSRGFVMFWIIAGLLMASGIVIAFWPVLRPYLMGAP